MKPSSVAEIHRDICVRENCAYLDQLDYGDPCAKCPNGHWGMYSAKDCAGPRPSGLGDKIASVAQPIARAIDRVSGTNIAKCGGCKKMRDRLNAGMPLSEALKLRIKGL